MTYHRTHAEKRNALKGINLGGWLVTEKWMTPSVYAGGTAKNEFELVQTAKGRSRLAKHHTSFITSSDIAWLRQQGIKIVRIPVGHWIFGDKPPYIGAIDRLDWVIEVCKENDIEVLIDMHAAPEAQNGADHSGSGKIKRDKSWLRNSRAQQLTIDVLVRLTERYKYHTNIWGIELLNEPTVDVTGIRLAWFYRRAYRALCKVARPGTRMVFSDGYAPLRLTNTFWLLTKPDFPAIMDCHLYQTFSAQDKKRSFEKSLQYIVWQQRLLRFLKYMQPVIVGEWSTVRPRKLSDEQIRQFDVAQRHAFSVSEAHFYWNYKTESKSSWNYRALVEQKLVQ